MAPTLNRQLCLPSPLERLGRVKGGDPLITCRLLWSLEAPNLLFENQGDGTFRECAREKGLDLVAASTGVAFADYDHDGDLDVYLLTNRVFGPRLPDELVAETTMPARPCPGLRV